MATNFIRARFWNHQGKILESKATELETTGLLWVRNALNENDLKKLDDVCQTETTPGVRLTQLENLSDILGDTGSLTQIAREFLPKANPVRVVVFNKSAETNWQVPWHQDRVIAVSKKCQINGYDNWTKKSGVWHVEPPAELLKNILFARIHLDDTNEENGCLEVAVGSHMNGRIDANIAADIAGRAPLEICRAKRGDVVFIKALTLHRSRPSRRNTQRRTLRIDYCADHLPKPLDWALNIISDPMV